ncbi:MAG: transposase, partial [Prevotellaceae bacterium]|nr:transposase [Prevotellaceae bacterium]
MITDTDGLPLLIVVHAANKHDSKTAFEVNEPLKYRFERMKKIYADGGYRGELAVKYQKKHGGVIVFYLCNDYDFTEYENFINDGKKREIEY